MNKIPEKEVLEKDYKELKSCRAVSEKYNCFPSAIYNWIRFYGIKTIPMKGRALPDDIRRKVSKSLVRGAMKGKRHSEETKSKMSEKRRGSKNPNYKGGKTERMRKIRRTKDYIDWRNAVIERANGKCEMCGRKLSLEAHHIKSIHKDISGVYDLNNGKALCNDCHLVADGKEKRTYA